LRKTKENKEQLIRDPVCGMWIEPDDAADIMLYEDKIFYFCAPGCKKAFEKEPEKFIKVNQEELSTEK